MNDGAFDHEVADGVPRIQTTSGILKDDLHTPPKVTPQQTTHTTSIGSSTVPHDFAVIGNRPPLRFDEECQRPRERRLAGPRCAEHAE